MRRIVGAAALGVCVLSPTVAVSADTLILRDGARISGGVIGIAARIVTFEDASGVSHRHTADEVAALEFSPGRGRNAAAGTTGNGREREVHAGQGGNTLGRAFKDSLRLYAVVVQFKRP